MPIVNGSLGDIIQGVSQQPSGERHQGQHEDMLNMLSDPLQRLTRRPPTALVGTVSEGTLQDITLNGVKHLLAFSENSIAVFNTSTGVEDIIDTSAYPYVNTSSKVAVFDDTVYVYNPDVTVEMLTDTYAYLEKARVSFTPITPEYANYYSIEVSFTAGGVDYVENINWRAPYGTATEDATRVDLTNIAFEMAESARANTNLTTFFDISETPPIIEETASGYPNRYASSTYQLVEKVTGSVTNLRARGVDSRLSADSAMVVFVDKVSSSDRLAYVNGVHGQYVYVAGSSVDGSDDQYFVFRSDIDGAVNGDGFRDSGAWEETVKAGIPYKFDLNTMPHIIDFDTMQVTLAEWQDRVVGNELNNEAPSFVGGKLNFITAFQGRLVFLSGANIVLSKSAEVLDFWYTSATSLVDNDPIDITSTVSDSGELIYAVPHNRDLVVFSNRPKQFIILGRNVVTPENTSLVQTSNFELYAGVEPIPVGRFIYFTFSSGNFTGMSAFYAEGASDINDTNVVSGHVKRLMPMPAKMLVSDEGNNIIFVLGGDGAVYAYEYFFQGNTLAQSAWGKWELPTTVKYITVAEQEIIFVLSDNTVLSMNFDRVYDTTDFEVHLDAKSEAASVAGAVSIPQGIEAYAQDIVVVDKATGVAITVEDITGVSGSMQLTLSSQYSGACVIGLPYMSYVVPTRPLSRDQNGNVIADVVITLKQYIVELVSTGAINVDIAGTVSRIKPIKTDLNFTYDRAYVTTETRPIFVRKRATKNNIKFYTDEHTPMNIVDIEYIYSYRYNRGRRR